MASENPVMKDFGQLLMFLEQLSGGVYHGIKFKGMTSTWASGVQILHEEKRQYGFIFSVYKTLVGGA